MLLDLFRAAPDRLPRQRKAIMNASRCSLTRSRNTGRLALLIGLAPLTQSASIAGADDAKSGNDRLTFEDRVVPILKTHCFKCHGAKTRKASLDLRRRFAMLVGGDSGAAIVPGKANESLLLEMVTSGDMPPEGEDRLTGDEIALLRRWIATGALTKNAVTLQPSEVDLG